MTTLTELFPESSLIFYGNGYPTKIMIDDSSAEREGLHLTIDRGAERDWQRILRLLLSAFRFTQHPLRAAKSVMASGMMRYAISSAAEAVRLVRPYQTW